MAHHVSQTSSLINPTLSLCSPLRHESRDSDQYSLTNLVRATLHQGLDGEPEEEISFDIDLFIDRLEDDVFMDLFLEESPVFPVLIPKAEPTKKPWEWVIGGASFVTIITLLVLSIAMFSVRKEPEPELSSALGALDMAALLPHEPAATQLEMPSDDSIVLAVEEPDVEPTPVAPLNMLSVITVQATPPAIEATEDTVADQQLEIEAPAQEIPSPLSAEPNAMVLQVHEDEPTLSQSLSRAQVLAGMRQVTRQVRNCGSSGLDRVVVDVTVRGSSGRVSRSQVRGPLVGTSEGSCVARAVRRAEFPRFSDEILNIRNFPFVLR